MILYGVTYVGDDLRVVPVSVTEEQYDYSIDENNSPEAKRVVGYLPRVTRSFTECILFKTDMEAARSHARSRLTRFIEVEAIYTRVRNEYGDSVNLVEELCRKQSRELMSAQTAQESNE